MLPLNLGSTSSEVENCDVAFCCVDSHPRDHRQVVDHQKNGFTSLCRGAWQPDLSTIMSSPPIPVFPPEGHYKGKLSLNWPRQSLTPREIRGPLFARACQKETFQASVVAARVRQPSIAAQGEALRKSLYRTRNRGGTKLTADMDTAVHLRVHVYIHSHTHIHIYMYTYTHIQIYIYIYIYMYIYIYIFFLSEIYIYI